MGFEDDEAFFPLPNFQAGDVDFMNTCFIAVIVNLRYLIPAVFSVLGLKSLSWMQVIKLVRGNKWHGKYGYDTQFHGQHDAADLLGDILFEDQDQSYNIFITKNNEVLPWKKFNANMSVSVEYDLKY